MKKKTIKEVIDTLYLKYKCIDNEDIWVEITDKYICINWNYGICGGECYSRKLSLDDFVKALVRRGIIKVEG